VSSSRQIASLDVAPIQKIEGSNILLSNIYRIALDSTGHIYVSNGAINGAGASSVNVFAPNANGNVAPVRTISGPATGLYEPLSVAVDAGGNLYVVNQTSGGSNSDTVNVFAPLANGDVAPIRTIVGPNTGLDGGAYGVAWHHGPPAAGRLYVIEATPEVAIFRANANGNVTPSKTISGALTNLDSPIGVAVGGAGRIYMANSAPSSWKQQCRATADRMIAGPNTGLSIPDGVAVH
jgi:serine/threonine protein kinase, bacterial